MDVGQLAMRVVAASRTLQLPAAASFSHPLSPLCPSPLFRVAAWADRLI